MLVYSYSTKVSNFIALKNDRYRYTGFLDNTTLCVRNPTQQSFFLTALETTQTIKKLNSFINTGMYRYLYQIIWHKSHQYSGVDSKIRPTQCSMNPKNNLISLSFPFLLISQVPCKAPGVWSPMSQDSNWLPHTRPSGLAHRTTKQRSKIIPPFQEQDIIHQNSHPHSKSNK